MNVSRHSQEAVIVSQLGVNGVSEIWTASSLRGAERMFPVRWQVGQKDVLRGLSARSWGDGRSKATVNHIHLLEPLEKGRLVRTAGDFLFTAAQGSNGRRWFSVEATALDGDGGNYQPKVTCSKCLSLARHWITPE